MELKNIRRILFFNLFFLLGINLCSQEVFDSTLVFAKEVLFFKSGVYHLSETNTHKLKDLITRTKNLNGIHFLVDAHTDDIGSESFNLKLSQQRGESVSNYLLKYNLSEGDITVRYHGEKELLAKHKDSCSRQANRKVIITVTFVQKFVELTGQLIDEHTSDNIQGSVKLNSFNFQSSANTNKNGIYKIVSPLNQIVEIEHIADNYFFNTKTIEIADTLKSLRTPMKKVKVGRKMILENMNFFAGQNELLYSSFSSFTALLNFMQKNENICIEIKGHINGRNPINGTLSDDLSIARALIIYEKLRLSGIRENRMLAKGYSNSQELYPDAKSEGKRNANRRVEIEIVDCKFISDIQNDNIIHPKYYRNIVEHRKFNSETFPNDIKYFFTENQSAIAARIRDLKNKGENPHQYTYAELLNEGENLKYKDNHLAVTLRKVYEDDQSLRLQIKEIESNYGINSIELKEHWDQINKLDSINLQIVKNIIEKNGWLGPEQVSSKGNQALFLVIQHADLETQLEYLPIIRKAATTGQVNREELALLEDRIAIKIGKKQIYGTQIHRDPITGKRFIAPLINPKLVNRRREELGLGTIENYILNWNLNWETELKRLEKKDDK